jgi:guanylate kinase
VLPLICLSDVVSASSLDMRQWITLSAGLAVAGVLGYYLYRSRSRREASIDAIVFSGPSGVGKGTIIKKLQELYPGRFAFSVSHTTRLPRAGEVDGVNYHFTDLESMKAMVQRGEFLECCNVHGNMYGTSKKALLDVQASGKMPIIEIDVQGVQKLRTEHPTLNVFCIFIQAPSMQELERRIVGRGQEAADKIKTRLETAQKEMTFIQSKAGKELYDVITTNDDLDATVGHIQQLLKKRQVL